ncbi:MULTISPECIES: homing endonuclease associated repeat-containing protein [Bacillus cereus group]|uniref:homing endonuclease associated repeat-containing protein n=1 Tax=Bacillus cereus group TaxID=86661 RepID=UPI000BF9FF1A|nr:MULTISPECIES: hypothetical protein [Bacillus cereus group]PFA18512.1 hypothetical protein CN373_18390 [Bacillus cereus]PFR23978.1 hypothetical protein COK19_19015 [Bacillus cereus]PGZ19521.1 hypothetical protein COE46_04550 [Bacillus cereus]
MYTRRILLSRLKEWAHSYQKLPTAKGILKDPNIPTLSIYVRHFGNWNESLRKAGCLIKRLLCPLVMKH